MVLYCASVWSSRNHPRWIRWFTIGDDDADDDDDNDNNDDDADDDDDDDDDEDAGVGIHQKEEVNMDDQIVVGDEIDYDRDNSCCWR